MAQTTVLTLMPQTAFPGDSPASFTGEPKQAASYYMGNSLLQTITWSVNNSFTGNVTIQATLVSNPTSTDWFNAININTGTTKTGYINLNGNFVWIRVIIQNWTAGAVNNISVSY